MKPDSEKSKLLGFIRDRFGSNNEPQAPKPPAIRVTKQDRLFAEIQHDQSLARLRDTTGREPTVEECKVPESLVIERAKGRLEARAKAIREGRIGNRKTIKRSRPSWER